MRILSSALWLAPVFGQIGNVQVAGTSATQAILSYRAPDMNPCRVEISEWPTYQPLVHDANPALFGGADQDSRPGSLALGAARKFVAGKRTVEYAADGKRYSRALQTDTRHYFRITCGAWTATGAFSTATVSTGRTYADLPPVDAIRPGELAWPTVFYSGPAAKVSTSGTAVTRTAGDAFDTAWKNGQEVYINEQRFLIASVTDANNLTLQSSAGTQSGAVFLYSARNYRYIDPETGVQYRMLGIPRDIRPATTTAAAFGLASGSNWTNPSQALGADGLFATYSGVTQDWLFLKAYRAVAEYHADFFNVVGFQAKADTANEIVQFCVTSDVDSSGKPVCDPIYPAPVELALSTTLQSYTVCKDAPCTVARVPGDFLGIGADTIPTRRKTAGLGKVSTTSGSAAVTFTNPVDCARLSTGEAIVINNLSFTVSTLNCGSSQVTVAPAPGFTAANFPYLYESGVYSNPRFGLLIRKKSATSSATISIDDVQYERGESFLMYGTGGGFHNQCSPAISANGFFRCILNTGGSAISPLYSISATSDEIRMGGLVLFFGQAYGYESGWQPCQSFGLGTKLWDATDPNVMYCKINDANGKGILLQITLNGNDAPVATTESTPLPFLPIGAIANLTPAPNDIRAQIAAWDASIEVDRYNWSLDTVQNEYLIVVGRRASQDSYAIVTAFKLNPARTSATLYALNKMWKQPASRWCSLHTLAYPGYESSVVEFGLQTGKEDGIGIGPYRAVLATPITSTTQTLIDVTSDWKQAQQSPAYGGTISTSGTAVTGNATSFLYEVQPGHTITAGGQTRTIAAIAGNGSLTVSAAFSPDLANQTWTYTYGAPPGGYGDGDPLSIFPDRYVGSAQVGDVFAIGSEYVRIVAKNSSSQWVVARGMGWGDFGSSIPATHPAGTAAQALCASGPANQQSGVENRWSNTFWDFVNSTDGSNANYYGPSYSLGVDHGALTTDMQINGWSGINGPITSGAYWNKKPYDWGITLAPRFAGKSAPANGNTYQGHPSMYAPLARGQEHRRFYDVRPVIGGGEISQSNATCQACGPYTLTGDLYRYTYSEPVDGLNRKHFATMGLAGDRALRDISGPGSAISGGASDAFKMCIAERADECVTGSSAGEIFVNIPGLEPNYNHCSGGEVNSGARDVCVADMSSSAQSVIQLTAPQVTATTAPFGDNYHVDTRVLGRMFNYWRRIGSTANVKALPSGGALIHGSGGHDRGSWLLKVPAFPARQSVNRSTFVPLEIRIGSAPAGTARVMARFGYAENGPPGAGYCTTRQEACYAAGSSVNEAAPFLWGFEVAGTSGVPCSSGCSLAIPALPSRLVYYQLIYRDGSGAAIGTGPVEVQAIP